MSKNPHIIAERIRTKLVNLQETVEQFAVAIEVNAYEALTWGDKGFEATAARHVYAIAVSFLDDDESPEVRIETLCKHATREIIRLGQCPEKSTGQCSNLLDRYTLVAWSGLVEYLSERE